MRTLGHDATPVIGIAHLITDRPFQSSTTRWIDGVVDGGAVAPVQNLFASQVLQNRLLVVVNVRGLLGRCDGGRARRGQNYRAAGTKITDAP
ncbi:hypothetical protein ACH41H_47000 [Streptomyces sp. NPDC020800]|uniref:hypothetical protein n=1 Tax=Streptomyces sp. NPDC020800 TaxID=3365092 RepID=UPI0037A431A8